MSPILISIIRWAARLTASVLALGFFVIAIGEPKSYLSATQAWDWVGMVFLLVAVLGMLFAWKWELQGALISVFALAAFVAVIHLNRYAIILVAMIPDFLFLIDWKLRRHQAPHLRTR
jgi:hypothetical protein